jgi:hypothetical protein
VSAPEQWERAGMETSRKAALNKRPQNIWAVKENGGGVNSSMIYLIYCKNLCKCHNASLPNTTK